MLSRSAKPTRPLQHSVNERGGSVLLICGHRRSGLENSSQLWPILWLSLQVSGFAVLVSSVVGLPLGVWMGLRRFRGKGLVVGLVHTGMALPPVVVGLLLYLLLSRSGPLGEL